jgi:hypothetical protein
MATDSRRQAIRRINLALIMEAPSIGGPAELARMLGTPKMKGHLSNVKAGRRGMGDDLAKAIEEVTGKPPGWMDEQHPVAGEAGAPWALAQSLSDPPSSDDLPLLSWEVLMKSASVPTVFRTVLIDDALAPDLPRGTEVVWTTRRRVAPGRAMLVRDIHGQVHARMCHQGKAPGQWMAASWNPVYASFQSTEEGLTVVAVYKGRLEPDDD